MAFYFAVSSGSEIQDTFVHPRRASPTLDHSTKQLRSNQASPSFHFCRAHRKHLCLWARGIDTPKSNIEIDFHFQNYKVFVLINSSPSRNKELFSIDN